MNQEEVTTKDKFKKKKTLKRVSEVLKKKKLSNLSGLPDRSPR